MHDIYLYSKDKIKIPNKTRLWELFFHENNNRKQIAIQL